MQLLGQIASVTDPLGNTTVYGYDLRGNKTCEGGAAYPVRYAYDIFGNKVTMTTFRDEAQTGGDVTTWLYDEPSGLVTNKLYADNKGPSYAYTPNGNLAARTWARGVVTAYAYAGWNSLTGTTYSDATPSITTLYDALGRQTEVRDAAGVTAYAYDDAGSLTGETVTGVAGTNVITRYWDAFGRPLGYALNGCRQTTLAYDPATGRLASMLAAGSNAPFVWSYLPGSDLKSQLVYPNGLSASWAYDAGSRLTQARNAAQGGAVSQYGYAYDTAGRCVSCAKSGSAMGEPRTDTYGYNARSELISSRRAAENAEEYAYSYDPIGNRQSSADLGVSRTYTANNLNQYTGVSTGGNTFAPQFDDDGNQTVIETKTGIWSVFYNGENRPTLWTSGSTNVVMSFDRMGRRVQYTETVGNVTNAHHTFVYDGYLQIADNAGNRYVWDPTEPVATRPLVWIHNADTYSYTHDGNKNVSEVVDANGAVTAHYEYAPFGDVTVTVGSLASANRFRFSSEYADDALGLVYYNYRHYNSLNGRWNSIDVLEDILGYSRYLFLNNQMFSIDRLGLYDEYVHYFLVFWMAQHLLEDPNDAQTLARGSQYPDTNAWSPLSIFLFSPKVHKLHNLTDIDAAKTLQYRCCVSDKYKDCIKNALGIEDQETRRNKLFVCGVLLHVLGDTYAHTMSDGTAYPPVVGHLFDGTAPDNPQNDIVKFRAFIDNVLSAFPDTLTAGIVKERLMQVMFNMSNWKYNSWQDKWIPKHNYKDIIESLVREIYPNYNFSLIKKGLNNSSRDDDPIIDTIIPLLDDCL